MIDAEHLDPTVMPPWLYAMAKDYDPAVIGWMAAAYVEGVKVGRGASPCGHTALGLFGRDLVCTLAFGHRGPHSNGEMVTWAEAAADLADPVVDKAADIAEDAARADHDERSAR